MSLVTLADIKTFLGITDNSQDALLTMFQESVEQSIKNFCDTDFTSHTVPNEIHDGIQSDTITPKGVPIISVQGVYLNVNVDGSLGTQLSSATDYYYDENLIRLRNQVTPFQRGSIKVAYTWGYAAVPGDVKMCVYQAVKAELARYKNNTEAVGSISKRDESTTYFGGVWDKKTGLPSQIVSKLQAYRVYEFPGSGNAQRNT